MGPVLCQTPQALGQGSSDMFPQHLGPGEMSFWAYCQGINRMIFFSQAPLHKPQGRGLKPDCAHSVMDMHSDGILGRGQSLTPVASTPGASHTEQHFSVIKGSNHAVLTVECSAHQPIPWELCTGGHRRSPGIFLLTRLGHEGHC